MDPVSGAEVLSWSLDALARWHTAWGKTRFLRNPGHTEAGLQNTLLYFNSDITHSLLCSNLQPNRSTEHAHVPSAQLPPRAKGAELGSRDFSFSAPSLPWIHITFSMEK